MLRCGRILRRSELRSRRVHRKKTGSEKRRGGSPPVTSNFCLFVRCHLTRRLHSHGVQMRGIDDL